jgi:hypothetical protein
MERKNMFTLNLDGKTDAYECGDLLLRQIDARMQAEEKELNDHYHKVFMGSVKSTVYSLIAVPFLVILGLILRVIPALQPYKTGIIGGIGIVIMAIIAMNVILNKKLRKKSTDAARDQVDRFYERCARALHVPEKAPRVDLFAYLYEEKEGARKNYYASGAYLAEFSHVFEENGNLCLYSATRVYAVPIASVEEFVRVDETVRFASWDKETPPNEGKYAPYNIVSCGNDEYAMNDYYRIRFTHEGTPYELLIASYDIEPFLEIIPLTCAK